MIAFLRSSRSALARLLATSSCLLRLSLPFSRTSFSRRSSSGNDDDDDDGHDDDDDDGFDEDEDDDGLVTAGDCYDGSAVMMIYDMRLILRSTVVLCIRTL